MLPAGIKQRFYDFTKIERLEAIYNYYWNHYISDHQIEELKDFFYMEKGLTLNAEGRESSFYRSLDEVDGNLRSLLQVKSKDSNRKLEAQREFFTSYMDALRDEIFFLK